MYNKFSEFVKALEEVRHLIEEVEQKLQKDDELDDAHFLPTTSHTQQIRKMVKVFIIF